jgi:hypothetical protein
MQQMPAKFILFFIALVSFTSTAQAQTAENPVYAGNEKWEYQTIDLWSNKLTSRITVKNLGISGNYLRRSFETINIASNGEITKPQFSEATVRADQNTTVMYRGEKMEKLWYKWPLESGKKWTFQVKTELPPTTTSALPQTMTMNTSVEVKGWEAVQVPSGKIKAIKLEYKSSWFTDSPTSGAGGNSIGYSWYSPEIKSDVQNSYESFGADGSPQKRTLTQLVLFKEDDK